MLHQCHFLAGTYYSTFTGYIHRLRGYHGLGETTYYHTTNHVFHPQMARSVGNGFSREWRAGDSPYSFTHIYTLLTLTYMSLTMYSTTLS